MGPAAIRMICRAEASVGGWHWPGRWSDSEAHEHLIMQIDTMSKILSVAVQRLFQDPDAHRSFSRQKAAASG